MPATVLRIQSLYAPRSERHRALHRAMDAHRFGAVVCHRRFGKTVLALNHLQVAALECQKERPRFAFIAPTYTQAKSIAWDYLVHYSSNIPGVTARVSELTVTYPNGGQVRLFGADNPDSLRGLYFDGLVLDEVAQMKGQVWGEILRPALMDRQGWAIFIGTPYGANLFSELYQRGLKAQDGWGSDMKRWSDTAVLSQNELDQAEPRRLG